MSSGVDEGEPSMDTADTESVPSGDEAPPGEEAPPGAAADSVAKASIAVH